MDFLAAVLSNTCSYCTAAATAANQTLQQTQGLGANQVPCCDPSNGIAANLLDSTCNVCNAVGDIVGLPSVPPWAWLLGAAVIGMVVLKNTR